MCRCNIFLDIKGIWIFNKDWNYKRFFGRRFKGYQEAYVSLMRVHIASKNRTEKQSRTSTKKHEEIAKALSPATICASWLNHFENIVPRSKGDLCLHNDSGSWTFGHFQIYEWICSTHVSIPLYSLYWYTAGIFKRENHITLAMIQ